MITVWVVPGARRNQVTGIYSDALRVRIAAPAERGRANKELISYLSEVIGVRLQLGGGAGSRRKRLVAAGVDVDDLAKRVARLVE
jgi:uncharacterized protein (TIGR00251 family)